MMTFNGSVWLAVPVAFSSCSVLQVLQQARVIGPGAVEHYLGGPVEPAEAWKEKLGASASSHFEGSFY